MPSGPHHDEGLFRRLVALTLLRIALVTVLLGASALVLLRSGEQDLGAVEQILYGLILAVYGASLAYLLVLRGSGSGLLHKRLAYAQIGGDTLISACLVYLTGGAESVLVFMLPLTVVSASVLLYRRGAVVAALLSSLGLLVVVLGLNRGVLPPAGDVLPQPMPVPRLLFFLFAHVAAIFLTAALSSYLAEQVRSTRERLSRQERDFWALEALHESIVRSIRSGIITTDRHGRVTFANPAAERIVAPGLAQALGEPLVSLLPSLAGMLEGPSASGRREVEHACPTGERLRLSVAVSPLLDRDGRGYGHLVALEDLTSVRAMQEAMERSERLAAVGAMAAGLAHELRNPLASMGGSIQLLQDVQGLGEQERTLMGIVLRESDRLNALVSDFLAFARPAPPELQPIDLADVVTNTVTLFRNDPSRSGVVVEAHLPSPLEVLGDAGQLGQVFWNLLGNAAEAMPGGGRIEVRGRREGGAVVLDFIDSGEGIAPEALPHVFEPFFTTKERGTGLGLATVHGIVTGHDGTVSVRSERGRGATFSIRLPAQGRPAALTA